MTYHPHWLGFKEEYKQFSTIEWQMIDNVCKFSILYHKLLISYVNEHNKFSVSNDR